MYNLKYSDVAETNIRLKIFYWIYLNTIVLKLVVMFMCCIHTVIFVVDVASFVFPVGHQVYYSGRVCVKYAHTLSKGCNKLKKKK